MKSLLQALENLERAKDSNASFCTVLACAGEVEWFAGKVRHDVWSRAIKELE
jgi:hypothetical protein